MIKNKSQNLRDLKKVDKRRLFLFYFVLFLFLCILTFIIAEITLRLFGKYTIVSQNDYRDTIGGGLKPGGLLKANFNSFVLDAYGGKVDWITNSVGFRNRKDFKNKPEPGVLRIISLGDSFTAGYRVGQRATFSFLLSNWLNVEYGKTEVLVSMVEHPGAGFKYLKNYGFEWKPDIVFYNITLGNDIAQSFVKLDPLKRGFRHGLEKLKIPKYCLKPKKLTTDILWLIEYYWRHSRVIQILFKPKLSIASWYGAVYRSKIFDPLNGLGFYMRNPTPEINEAYKQFFKIIDKCNEFLKSHKVIFVLTISPQRFQVQSDDWNLTAKMYRLNKNNFDLNLPNKRIQKFCKNKKILFIDPTFCMANVSLLNNFDMYMPMGDMHWNEIGHKTYFECLKISFEKIVKKFYRVR